MLPLLLACADGEDHRSRDLVQTVSDHFALTDQERKEMLGSGEQTVISNRVGWAKTYLKRSGLLDNPQRGVVRLSARGQQVLKESPEKINIAYLRKYPEFQEFRLRSPRAESFAKKEIDNSRDTFTPEESLEASHAALLDALAVELLEQVKKCSPSFFEGAVVKLLVAMGYGGSLADAAQVVGGTGDGGIDGIIKEDKLGLDVVCIQAKRWQSAVGRPDVQAFAGSMEGRRARKGVLITTSFSRATPWNMSTGSNAESF